MNIEELVDAWHVSNIVNLELLDLIQDEQLDLKPLKGKTIRSNFVHIIGVRAQWISEKIPEDAVPMPKLDWKTASRDEIKSGLSETCVLMERRFRLLASKPSTGKNPLLVHFAYCIAHEANHRGQIEMALRINDQELSVKGLYGLWDWHKK